MPIHSRWNIPIDNCSFQEYLFGKPGAPVLQNLAFLDADKPDTHFLTIEDFRLWSQRLAVGLKKAGLQPGDRVLLFSGNNLFFPVAFLGILMAGGIFTGANPSFVARELAYQLKDSEAKFLFCADSALKLGIEAAESIGMDKSNIFVFDDSPIDGTSKSILGVRNWVELFAPEEVGKKLIWHEPADPKDAICCLNYSSGTTGVPKGVMITHYNYVSNATQFAYLGRLHPDYEGRVKRAKWLCYLPLYHAMAQTIMIAGGPKQGIPVYIMKKFDFVGMLEAVQKFKITTLAMVPPIVVTIAKSPLTKNYDLSSVVDIGSGAAPLGGDIIKEAEALWPSGDRKLKQGWGMTEGTCSLLGWDPNREILPDSVGELNANCHAKIVDDEGKEVPVGQRGEIWVQAPNVMKGYWRNPKATAEIFVDDDSGRWMRTGDVAYVDDQGRFFIVDRMKELIKVKGNQVAPAELEALLLEHPAVADAAVIGVPLDGDEVPRAYILKQPGKNFTGKEIADWLAERVTKYKRLVGGVVFVDEIPKNPSGKILRKLLREKAKADMEGGVKSKL